MLSYLKHIVNYKGNIKYISINTARVPCIDRDSTTVQLVLKNILYISIALFNLVSVGTLRISGYSIKFVP